jgi:hypothetical protein
VYVILAPGGASGTIKADLGAYGHIDLTFSAGGGARTTPGCPGALLFEHTGTLSGSFHFVSHSSYFGTIDMRILRGYTAAGQKAPNCKPPTPSLTHGTALDVFSEAISGTQPSARLIDVNVERDLKGHILEALTVLEPASGRNEPTIIHAIDRSNLAASASPTRPTFLRAATASGMFMSGTLNYMSSAMLGPNQTTGSIAGSIVAHFDGLAPITLPARPSTSANLNFTP